MWAVTGNGDVLFREGVRVNCPEGNAWTQVKADVQFQVCLFDRVKTVKTIREKGGFISIIEGRIGWRRRLKGLGAG